jgi:hypothetical protein
MSCERFESTISLYLYGELGEEETEALEEHLENCATCSEVLEEEKRFVARLNERSKVPASESMLAECRHDLMRAVYRDETVAGGSLVAALSRWRAGLPRALASARLVWQPTAALALAALAFYAGRATQTGPTGPAVWPPTSATQASLTPEFSSITGVQSIADDPEHNNVQIVVEEITRRTIAGSPRDPQIRRLLLSSIRSAPSSGVRLDTLDVLTRRVEDREIRQTLLHSMLGDSNPGVRLKAIEALKSHTKDPEVRLGLVEVLRSDANSGMRVQAIDLLTETPDRDIVGVLQELIETEANEYVRLRSLRTLEDLGASVNRF